MSKVCFSVLFFVLFVFLSHSQIIKGSFPQAKNTEIVLKGYEGFTERELAKATTDSLGSFSIVYPKEFLGVSILEIKNASRLVVLLNNENFEIEWGNFKDYNTLKFSNSLENDFFTKAISLNQETEQKLAGLKYLLPLYEKQKEYEVWFKKEINKQEQLFENFIEKLPKDSYAKSYLKLRKFLLDVRITQEKEKQLNRVIQHEANFKKIDFSDDNLWYSGLLKEIVNNFYDVLDLYQDKDSIINHCIIANDVWLKSLKNHPVKQKELAEFCFTLLEKKNLTKASEYIALTMLNNDNCQLSNKQIDLFEQYRKLGIGKTAPNIDNLKDKKSLKDLTNKYKLIVFGASWCPNCQTNHPSLVGKYKDLKDKYDIEIVYISIDTDKVAFENYYKEAPFITYCDFKGWETQAAKDYHLYATPTYFLLNDDLKIIAKPSSVYELENYLTKL